MKVAIVTLLACCLFVLVIIALTLFKIRDNQLNTIVDTLDALKSYKHDDIYFKLSEIRDDLWKLIEQKKEWFKDAEKVKPDPPDALVVEPCPICGSIPAMYKHTDLDSYCVRCSKGFGSRYDGSCSCSFCVVSDDKIEAITVWNGAVNDYIIHKNEEV